MVRAYHIIFTAYGFWLPNDPRGSWSNFVASWELLKFGKATTTTTIRRSVAAAAHDATLRRQAKTALKHPPVLFTGRQAAAIARGFAQAIRDAGYGLWALSILPDHVHAVLQRHVRRAEVVVGHLKAAAVRQLRLEGLHPFAQQRQTPWVQGCWKVYLNDDRDIRRAIQYVENNPPKQGMRIQRWSMVQPYSAI